MINEIITINWQQMVMLGVGGFLIWLGIKKRCEPTLLVPMGVGAMLVNFPATAVLTQTIDTASGKLEAVGIIEWLFHVGIDASEALPILLFIGIGAIAVVAYSYMALVPLIQPLVIKALTSKKERCIRMPYIAKDVSTRTRILFPIIVIIAVGFLSPKSLGLVGALMFGNLLREAGRSISELQNLSDTAQGPLTNLISLLLGLTFAFQLQGASFVNVNTLIIMGIGIVAFVVDITAGVLLAKEMNLFLKQKINPMIGAAGISAFPMASRVVQNMAQEEKPGNIIIMHAAGANVAGQIASAVAGGLVIRVVSSMM